MNEKKVYLNADCCCREEEQARSTVCPLKHRSTLFGNTLLTGTPKYAREEEDDEEDKVNNFIITHHVKSVVSVFSPLSSLV